MARYLFRRARPGRTVALVLAVPALLIAAGHFRAPAGPTAPMVAVESSALYAVDGDTLDLHGERIRIEGVDTPEMAGACPAEIEAAHAARNHLARLIALGPITVQRLGQDRYGRTLARVFWRGDDVARLMIAQGHGRAYYGGRRSAWCSMMNQR